MGFLQLERFAFGIHAAPKSECGCSGQYVDDMHLYIIRLLLVHTAWKKATVKMRAKVTRQSGFTLVEIMIVVAIIGLLAAIAVPNFVKARTTSQTDACYNNLRQIDGAAQTFGMENNKQPINSYTLSEIKVYLRLGPNGELPACPGGGSYGPGLTFGAPPFCTVHGHLP